MPGKYTFVRPQPQGQSEGSGFGQSVRDTFDRFAEWFTSPKTEELGIKEALDQEVQGPEKQYIRTPTEQIDPLKPVPNQSQSLLGTARDLLVKPFTEPDNPVAQAASLGFDKGQIEGFTTPRTLAMIPAAFLPATSMVAAALNLGIAAQGVSEFLNPELSGFDNALGAVDALGGGAAGALGGVRAVKAGIKTVKGLRTAKKPETPPIVDKSLVTKTYPETPIHRELGIDKIEDLEGRPVAGPANLTMRTANKIEESYPIEFDDPNQTSPTPIKPTIVKALEQEFGLPEDPTSRRLNPKALGYSGNTIPMGSPVDEMARLKGELEDVPASITDELEADFKMADRSADARFKAYQDLKKADTVKGAEETLKESGAEWSDPTVRRTTSAKIDGTSQSTSQTLKKAKPKGKEGVEIDLDMQGGDPSPSTPSPKSAPAAGTAPLPKGVNRFYANKQVALVKAKNFDMQVVGHPDGTFEIVPYVPTRKTPKGETVPAQTFRTWAEARGVQKKQGGEIKEDTLNGKRIFRIIPDDGGKTPNYPPSTSNNLAKAEAEAEGPVFRMATDRRGSNRINTPEEDAKWRLEREGFDPPADTPVAPVSPTDPVVPGKGGVAVEEPSTPAQPSGPKATYLPQRNPADVLAEQAREAVRRASNNDFSLIERASPELKAVIKSHLEASPAGMPKAWAKFFGGDDASPTPVPKVDAPKSAIEQLLETDSFTKLDEPPVTNASPPGGIIPVQALKKSPKDVAGDFYRARQKEATASGEKLGKKYRDDPTSDLSSTPRAQSARIAGKSLSKMDDPSVKADRPANAPSTFDPNYQQDLSDLESLPPDLRKKAIDAMIKEEMEGPSKSNPESGKLETLLALRMAGGLGGAAYGATQGDDLESRLRHAAVYGGLGTLGPDIARYLPDALRFAYLARFPNLAINAWLGPYGAGIMGSLEHALADTGIIKKMADAIPALEGKGNVLTARGRTNKDYPWANKALKESLDPVQFLTNWSDARDEALQLNKQASSRGEFSDRLTNAPKIIKKVLQWPGINMLMGDLATKKTLTGAGAPEKVARAVTLTDEASMPAAHKITGIKRGAYSALMDTELPFVRTLANQAEATIERTPLLGVLAQYRFKNSPKFGTGPDPKNLILAQQILGTGVPLASFVLGTQIPPDVVGTPVVGKVLSNFGAQYGGLAVAGFAAGQAVQMGLPWNEALGRALMVVKDSLPLPTAEPIQEQIDIIRKREFPSINPQASNIIDLLTGEKGLREFWTGEPEAVSPPSNFQGTYQFVPPE